MDNIGHSTLILFVSHQKFLGVRCHVELKRKGEVCINFLFHHSHHVERITHRVKTQNPRKNLKTCPTQNKSLIPLAFRNISETNFRNNLLKIIKVALVLLYFAL